MISHPKKHFRAQQLQGIKDYLMPQLESSFKCHTFNKVQDIRVNVVLLGLFGGRLRLTIVQIKCKGFCCFLHAGQY